MGQPPRERQAGEALDGYEDTRSALVAVAVVLSIVVPLWRALGNLWRHRTRRGWGTYQYAERCALASASTQRRERMCLTGVVGTN